MDFDPQTATGLSVTLYYGDYASQNCAWNRTGARPKSVVIVATRDDSYGTGALEPLPEDQRANTSPGPDRPAAVLVKRRVGRVIYSVEPLTPSEAGRTPFMAGGSYAGSSDSRLGELTGGMYGALSVHDYSETWAAYRAMTVD